MAYTLSKGHGFVLEPCKQSGPEARASGADDVMVAGEGYAHVPTVMPLVAQVTTDRSG